ncbi:hypothetical protein [Listeria phage List-36]|uniref:Terminase small subunit n=4 Tax=Pecentumvirus TaxID=1857844 RepID=A0A060ALC9_9CAUD|nr:terminase small subunit [Listeria phage List-36]YP_009793615.1 hypothetical protein QLX41_gp116 [Listeria phage LMTA-94]AII27353.1 putative terminase small subunit [Listeria phage LMTA-34]QIG60820.1 hypothetical protein vBLinoVEfB7_077 [Listeria phage vB_Lino_VEfB7]QIG61008.1 hypothetical protein vBLivaVAfA18_084 [Listeria phage vB_Liva_VAfA18]AIA64273.1 hypothetical protein [Listeria phage List-36]AID17204.1 hypothetical protein [Listeria phage LMTA-94]
MNLDNIERNLSKKKTTGDAVKDEFNDMAMKLLAGFKADVSAGDKKLEDVADMARLLQTFIQVNKEDNGSGGTSTSLPELSNLQQEAITNQIKTESVVSGDKEQELVDLQDLANMTEEDVQRMIMDKEKAMNMENEETF